ncbi:putative 125 kDa kinesin-related protein [Smittium mucronatum]|uniref:Putative 125 kDa kinesin-related protein n=1 Tax=Smittium mucronatum TaxID=133383 RepID=A0A1R0GSZ0_9FUNG|nr:putative 125 kDa kinesin-related protein [Smittium mucronatum]
MLTSSANSSRNEPQIPPSAQKQTTSNSTDDKEMNIQVVVRCRGLTEKEKKEKTPKVITVPMFTGREVNYKNGSINRTYTFDKVFGPEADQETVYQDVAMPILKEVLQGLNESFFFLDSFNCTIFAYGQTGTGKTYTMEGNMDSVNQERSSEVGIAKGFDPDRLARKGVPPEAGIIPRVLQRMFYLLDQSSQEYSVSVSHLELYNEELRDLLADSEDSPSFPINNSGDNSRIRIYDDGAGKGGIVIQGLEEKLVRSSNDAIKLLQRGSQRRQVANTKCNEFSSRSHSIYMLTVHIKEKNLSKAGEDLIKIGKLNLVDLAGSENIGRSGAEQRRAREAGMINQSLLTLGRVINSLVDRSPHVPYRESKLTRLLRDSLGGKTKTCLIATICPSKSSIEETLSTLDYANRAKSIRNRPEANKKVTQTALVGDLQLQIERLQMDLAASHSKNGIFLSTERYKELVEDSEYKSTQADEWKQRVELREAELKTVHNEAKELMNKCYDLEQVLMSKNSLIEEKDLSIKTLESSLNLTENLLKEQKAVNKVHADNEFNLNLTADSLAKFSYKLTNEIEMFYDKMDRVDKSTSQKRKLLFDFKVKASSLCTNLIGKLDTVPKIIGDCLELVKSEFTNSIQKHYVQDLEIETTKISKILETASENALEKFEASISKNKSIIEDSISELNSFVNGSNSDLENLISFHLDKNLNKMSEFKDLTKEKNDKAKEILSDKTSIFNNGFLSIKNRLCEYKTELKKITESLKAVKTSQTEFLLDQKKRFSKLHSDFSDDLVKRNAEIIHNLQRSLEENAKAQSKMWEMAISDFGTSSKKNLDIIDYLNHDSIASINGFDMVIDDYSSSINKLNSSNSSANQNLLDVFSELQSSAESISNHFDENKSKLENDSLSIMHKIRARVSEHNESVSNLNDSNSESAFEQLGNVKTISNQSIKDLNSCILNTKSQLIGSFDDIIIKNLTGMKKETGEAILASKEGSNIILESMKILIRESDAAENLSKSGENGAIVKTPQRQTHLDVSEISWKITRPMSDIISELRDDENQQESAKSLDSDTDQGLGGSNPLSKRLNKFEDLSWASKTYKPDLSSVKIAGKSVKRKCNPIKNINMSVPFFSDLSMSSTDLNSLNDGSFKKARYDLGAGSLDPANTDNLETFVEQKQNDSDISSFKFDLNIEPCSLESPLTNGNEDQDKGSQLAHKFKDRRIKKPTHSKRTRK